MLESRIRHHHRHHHLPPRRVARHPPPRRVAHRDHHHHHRRRVARHLAKIQNMKPVASLLKLLRNSSSNGSKWV